MRPGVSRAEQVLQEAERFPWWRLTHCRGFATDVPRILRDLTSPDEDTRSEACNDGLFDRLSHQYTLYPAGVYALPFIVALVSEPSASEKLSMLSFLENVAKQSRRKGADFWTSFTILPTGLLRL